jgi:D-alanine-D-alanine ligase
MIEASLSAASPLAIPPEVKARTRLLFLAKHACGDGRPDATDGNHAIYHHELRTTLEAIGFDVTAADSYEALFKRPQTDFVIPLLNRGGFQNSEMLAPLLLARHGLPYLGATPIIRGLADDKHLMKVLAHRLGVPTSEWVVLRRGQAAGPDAAFRAERYVVKPNASSASWGVTVVEDWASVGRDVEALHAQGHDAIVEAWAPLIDVAAPVIGARGPWLLPPMAYLPDDLAGFRNYEVKRGLAGGGCDPLEPLADSKVVARVRDFTALLLSELWPFDYGRFEFRFDPATGALSFMEVNLSCNLWSRKTISRAAAHLGVEHRTLVETIVAHSLARQGLLSPALLQAAA